MYENLMRGNLTKNYYCPITKGLMRNPVIVNGIGHTYEKTAIESWFNFGNNIEPLSGKKIKNPEFTPNHTLKSQIELYKAELLEQKDAAKYIALMEKHIKRLIRESECYQQQIMSAEKAILYLQSDIK
jgi:hypothetical protein